MIVFSCREDGLKLRSAGGGMSDTVLGSLPKTEIFWISSLVAWHSPFIYTETQPTAIISQLASFLPTLSLEEENTRRIRGEKSGDLGILSPFPRYYVVVDHHISSSTSFRRELSSSRWWC